MKKNLVFGQVIILVLGIIAISYAVGSEVGVVSAKTIVLTTYSKKGDIYSYNTASKEWLKQEKGKQNAIKLDKNSKEVQDLNQYLIDEGLLSTAAPNQINVRTSVASVPASNPVIDETLEEYYAQEEQYQQSQNKLTQSGETTEDNTVANQGYKLGFDYDYLQKNIATDPETGESKWSFYKQQHLFGTNAKNTVTYNENTYFYELADDKKTKKWYEVSGGDRKPVSDEVAEALNAGKGKTVGGGGWTDAGKRLLATVGIAESAKALAVTIAGFAGTSDEQAAALGEGVRLGVYAASITDAITEFVGGRAGGYAGAYIGVITALWYIAQNYKELDERSVTFECAVWEAPKGGTHCQDCNDAIFGCSEYQCKSLGKGCELLNPGTDEELCSWVNRNDAEAPEIRPNKEAISTGFQYTDDNSISPPEKGVQIIPEGGSEGDCVEAYTPLTFGVSLDEPATCKVDVERKDNYEDMSYYLGASSTMKYNHTHIMTLPSIEAEGTVIEEGTNMSLFVRCEDANGNSNEAEYLFNFCVEQGEDFTPPYIVETSISDNSPVQYNISSTTFTAYINEPVNCRWDFTDKRYDLMNASFSCSKYFEARNAQTVYPCTTTLTGIKDRAENDYYIRCNDTSGNENKESTKLTLVGTQPLYIDFAEPNDTTVKEATPPVPVTLEVETSSGADDGKAFCYYKPVDSLSYVQFLYSPLERTYQHMQQLNLAEGTYEYDIKCSDAGGNDVFETILFDVEVDSGSPVVIRAYREEGYLKLITDESGECVYNNDEDIGCKYEFDDGISMQTVDEDEHFVEWDSQKTYYIKCKDEFDNPPAFSDCSIVARPSSGQTL